MMWITTGDSPLLFSCVGDYPTVLEAVHLYWMPAVLLLLLDSWFFLVHRTLHRSPFLFKHIHSIHHQRRQVTAWDLFHMHPAECAVCVALPFCVLPHLVPLHWIIWEGLVVQGIMIDVYGAPGGVWRGLSLQGLSASCCSRLLFVCRVGLPVLPPAACAWLHSHASRVPCSRR
jgi:hypothetical protein